MNGFGGAVRTDDSFAKILASYISPLVIDRLLREKTAISAPCCEKFSGAILDIDIVGFTSLTERMEHTGQEGLEVLSRLLDHGFTRFITVVEAHGGAVLEFAGDGIVAGWFAPPETLTEAATLSAHCARALLDVVREPTMRSVNLALHLGLGVGSFSHALLGGFGERWLSVISGGAMDQARHAAQRMQYGYVGVSRDAWDALKNHFSAIDDGEGVLRLLQAHAPLVLPVYRLPTVSGQSPPDAMRPHVAPAVHDAIPQALGEWLPEFRRLTVLFLGLPGLACESSAGFAETQAAIGTIQKVLLKYGVTVENLVHDLGGFTVLAAAGLPPLAREDDPLRMVRSAQAIRRDLRNQGFRCGAAITTGSLYCGSFGNPQRREYAMLGDTTNRAARLMRLATDDLLCDEATARSISRHCVCEFVGPRLIRGKAQPVATYRPHEEQTATAPLRGAVIGRKRERRTLHDQLATTVAAGESSVWLIEGDAGIGKTTIVQEVLVSAAARGVHALLGSGDSVERTGAYHAWRPFLRSLLQLLDTPDPEVRAAAFHHHFGADAEIARYAPLLNFLTGLQLPDNETTAQMTAQSRAETVRTVLVNLINGTIRGPALIALDDCQWLDSASWALVLELQRQLNPLMLVLLARTWDGPEPQEWRAFAQLEGARYLRLAPMPEQEALLLVQQRLGVSDLPEAVRTLVATRAEGHPFYCEQLAFSLRDAGVLLIEEGRCRMAENAPLLQEVKLPDTVHGVIRERIDHLPPEARLAIKMASVIGRDFSLETLREIHPLTVSHAELPRQLERLVEADLAVALSGYPQDAPVYRFKHALTQEAAYTQMTPSQRQHLHRSLAEWIERSDAPNLDPHFALLAHHWSQAAVSDKAVTYFGRAGEQAFGRFANQEAVIFLEKALSLSDAAGLTHDPLTLGHWHRQLGEAQFHLGRMTESRRHLEAAVMTLGFPFPARSALKLFGLPRAVLRRL